MSEYLPVLLQYQALYQQYLIAQMAREAGLPPEEPSPAQHLVRQR
jgi:hypothetical protein